MQSFTVETIVNHNVSHTWEFYFNQINSWWPKEYFSSSRTKRFLIQTFIGGKAFEDFGEGDGLIWGEIIGVDYLKSLEIKGNLTKSFGGPLISFEKYLLEEMGDKTKLSYTVDFIIPVDSSTVNSLEKGWKDLIQVHFKKYCEGKD